MKIRNLIIALLTTSLLFIGCSDRSLNISEPEEISTSQSFSFEKEFNSTDSSNKIIINLYNSIEDEKDDDDDGGFYNNLFSSVSKIIYGWIGGNLNLVDAQYGSNGLVSVASNLNIPPGAFTGIQNITMTADLDSAALIFSPHPMNFNRPLVLNLIFKGIDFNKLPESEYGIAFCYLSPDGSIVPCENEGIKVDRQRGILMVKNAKIYHFSRYGWVK